MTITATRVTIDDLLTTPQALRRVPRALRSQALTAQALGSPLAPTMLREAAELTVLVEQRIRLASTDRHTRAIAQAEAAGITGLRDAFTANA